VQRVILAAFAAEPDNAFLLSQLCEQVYPGCNGIEKKHRIAVARAAKAIPSIDCRKRETLGSELVFYDPLNVMSYAMARLKSDHFGPGAGYRNNDYCPVVDITSWRKYDITSDEIFRRMLAPGGNHHRCVVEGGAWWQHTEIRKAQARGDEDTAARLQAEMDAEIAVSVTGVKSSLEKARRNG
jgi:hypothetical protein